MSKASRRGIHRARRLFQLGFFLLFIALLTLTVWPLGNVYLGAFLVGDPLIAINSAVSGELRVKMMIELVMLVAPLFNGRAFCGYICPMGAAVQWTAPKKRGVRLSPGTRDAWRKV